MKWNSFILSFFTSAIKLYFFILNACQSYGLFWKNRVKKKKKKLKPLNKYSEYVNFEQKISIRKFIAIDQLIFCRPALISLLYCTYPKRYIVFFPIVFFFSGFVLAKIYGAWLDGVVLFLHSFQLSSWICEHFSFNLNSRAEYVSCSTV